MSNLTVKIREKEYFVFNLRSRQLLQFGTKKKIVSIKNFMRNSLNKKDLLFSDTNDIEKIPVGPIAENDGFPFLYLSTMGGFINIKNSCLVSETIEEEGDSSDDDDDVN